MAGATETKRSFTGMISTIQPERLFLHLLQASLWEKVPEVSCFCNVPAEIWKEIYQMSVLQGVQAIVFDAVVQLPPEFYPPQDVKLPWATGVKQIEMRAEYKRKVLAELGKLYRKKDIRIILLKGIGLAACYPVPAHRESGDIDLWLLGANVRGDDLMRDLGKKVYHWGQKHTCSYYKGIPVENHVTLLNVDRFFIDRQIEATLHHVFNDEGYETLTVENETVFFPTPTFNAIFNARHIATHLPREIVIRHLCDWSLFLYANQGKYDVEKFTRVFRETGGYPVISLLTRLAVEYIGLPVSAVPFKIETNLELEARVLKDILYTPGTIKAPYSNFICNFLWRCRRFYREHWKYKLIYNESLPQRIFRSIQWFYRNDKNPFC
jgi:hypothetical protein